MKLSEEFTPLGLGDLRLGRAVTQRSPGIETLEMRNAERGMRNNGIPRLRHACRRYRLRHPFKQRWRRRENRRVGVAFPSAGFGFGDFQACDTVGVQRGQEFPPRMVERITFRDLFQVLPRMIGKRLRFAEKHDGFGRQIIKQHGEVRFTRQSTFSFGHSAFRIPHSAFQQSQLAAGREDDRFDFFTRDLREGIEVAQRLQFIPEEFQPHRPRAGERENVHDAAAQGQFALLRDLRLRLIALVFEPFDQVQRRQPVAAPQRAGIAAKCVRWKRALEHRRDARDHHRPGRVPRRGARSVAESGHRV